MKNVLTTLLLTAVTIVLLLVYLFFGPGGPADQKATYGTMQGVELEYRGKHIQTPFILEADGGLRLVGFETSDDKFPYAWLALTLHNTESADGVFKVGSAPPWKLTCVQVQDLLVKEKTSERVALFLRRQCKDN